MIPILFRDARTILDLTYGNGAFWKGFRTPENTVTYAGRVYELTTIDIDPEKNPDIVADFTKLGMIKANQYDLVIFDPPYHTDVSKKNPTIVHNRFSSYDTIEQLKDHVLAGMCEATRIAKIGIIAKVQDYIHGSKAVWMSDWLKAVAGEPFDVVYLRQKYDKPIVGEQYSMYRNHTTFWAFRNGSQYHKARYRMKSV